MHQKADRNYTSSGQSYVRHVLNQQRQALLVPSSVRSAQAIRHSDCLTAKTLSRHGTFARRPFVFIPASISTTLLRIAVLPRREFFDPGL